uniref:Cyclic AMP-dependent transcription factor ATF-6 alpha-like n=1 Tax=Drosophila rhopaloa TaxID=1041015 RepID=A0A6P4ED16_DRORH
KSNNIFFPDDLSLYGITPQNEYDKNFLDDIINSSISGVDTSSLEINDLMADVEEEPIFSGLDISSNQIRDELDCSLNSITSISSYPCLKRNPSMCFAEYPKNLNGFNKYLSYDATTFHLECGNSVCHMHDRDTPSPTGSFSSSTGSSTSGIQSDITDVSRKRPLERITANSDKCGKFFKTIKYSRNNKEFNSTYLNLPAINESLQKTSLELDVSSSYISKIYQSPTNCKQINNDKTKPQVLEKSPTTLPTIEAPKTIFLSPNDYKALMQKIQLNGIKSSKINGSIGTKKPNIVMKKSNEQLIQLLEETQAHMEEQKCNHTNNSPKFEFYNTLTIDEKIYKKQQRMIKNRESASLSRKKRKDYVFSLETRINKLEREYDSLKLVSKNI